MNKPTPLGKTYEQYEKELKEYKEINLSKVERVEFGLLEDLVKVSDTKEVTGLRLDINNGLDKVRKYINKGSKISKSNKKLLEKRIDTILKKAKELGMEKEVKGSQEYKDAIKSINIFENNIEFFDRVLSSIPKN